jgi:hypothetical protein
MFLHSRQQAFSRKKTPPVQHSFPRNVASLTSIANFGMQAKQKETTTMMNFRNLALTSLLMIGTSSSAFAADCRTILSDFFNSIESQDRSVYVERTTNALWNTDNVSNFAADVQGSNSVGPNRFISKQSNVKFLDSDGKISRVDKETVTITEHGLITVTLNSWANTVTKPKATYCDRINNDQILIQAINSTGSRKTLYNFSLIKTIIVLFHLHPAERAQNKTV